MGGADGGVKLGFCYGGGEDFIIDMELGLVVD
jgi:hypothetical protein